MARRVARRVAITEVTAVVTVKAVATVAWRAAAAEVTVDAAAMVAWKAALQAAAVGEVPYLEEMVELMVAEVFPAVEAALVGAWAAETAVAVRAAGVVVAVRAAGVVVEERVGAGMCQHLIHHTPGLGHSYTHYWSGRRYCRRECRSNNDHSGGGCCCSKTEA